MRVLFLTHRLPYAPNRGDRVRAYHMLRHLATHADVDLVSLVHDDDEASHADDLKVLTRSVTTVRVRRLRGARRAVEALLTRRPLTHALLDAAELPDVLKQRVARARPDVVLAYCSGMARLALEPPLRDIPFVLDMVDVDSEKWAALARRGHGPKAWIYRREARLLGQFEQRAVSEAATTLVVNERERDVLRRMGPAGRVEVMSNGVELAGLTPRDPPAAEPRVVFCGVMNYEPNEAAACWFAREVWPLVTRARPDATLTLVGANPTRRLRDLARTNRSIEVTGSVPAVQPYLWRSAISVAPLLVARGLQNKVLEATAAGLPSVITTAVCDGLPAKVRPACVVADAPAAFADAVVQLLALTALERRAMALRADLDSLGWSQRLNRLVPVLAAASSPTVRLTA